VLKRILVPLDLSPYTDTAVRLAATMAKIYDAEITGLVVLDIPGIEKSIGPIPLGALHFAEKIELAKKTEASQRIETLMEKFADICDKEGIAYTEAHEQGYPSHEIIEVSKYYDLIIMGLRTFYQFETSDKAGDSLENMLKESITPVMGVPKNFHLNVMGGEKLKVLIAHDGGLQSARALQRFGQLSNSSYMDITILNSSDDKKAGNYILDHAEAYLKARDVTGVKKEWTSQDIIQVIKDKYYDTYDVFCVGAHAKEGLFDFMVGSLTRFLVKQGEKPVFIGQ
jgi:nucleotide-binding universal stress UspA family protein